jgi:catechol 2,3-dioxygenase-like lactoylglutathione lyase family enzyme
VLRRIDRIILSVPALPGAVKYYRDVLGMNLVHEDARSATLLMSDGQTRIVLRSDPDQPMEEIYYLVEDVRKLYLDRDRLRLKFVQPPREAETGFFAAVKDPFGNVLLLIDRIAAEDAYEDDAAPNMLFPGIEPDFAPKQQILIDLYQQVGRTADDLPYTPDFEQIYNAYSTEHAEPQPTRREVWRHLLNLRKGGKLPRLGEARSPSPQVSTDDEKNLRELLGDDIGKRDRLPYTQRFDEIVDHFNRRRPRPLSPHLVWRLVAKLAK